MQIYFCFLCIFTFDFCGILLLAFVVHKGCKGLYMFYGVPNGANGVRPVGRAEAMVAPANYRRGLAFYDPVAEREMAYSKGVSLTAVLHLCAVSQIFNSFSAFLKHASALYAVFRRF